MALSDDMKKAVSKKIGILIHAEGKDPKQAAAIAYSMAREHRLTADAHYVRVGEKLKR